MQSEENENKEVDWRENKENPFVGLGLDSHYAIAHFLPLADVARVSLSCFGLYQLYKPALNKKLAIHAVGDDLPVEFNMLRDIIALTPELAEFPFTYVDLAHIVRCAKPLLHNMFFSDPDAAWKIAALLGLTDIVNKLLGDNVRCYRDDYGRGVLDYYVLGGQLLCMQTFIADYYPNCEAKTFDPELRLTCMAAMGGHIEIMQFLQRKLHYDLKMIFPKRVEDECDESLLTHAVWGGHEAMVNFLIEAGVSQEVGPPLYLIAAEGGYWRLHERFILDADKFQYQKMAKDIGEFACITGNLNCLIKLGALKLLPGPGHFKEAVIQGGKPNVFWYFIQQKWLSLNEPFKMDTIDCQLIHMLAFYGHLELIRAILADNPQLVYALDSIGRSIAYYAAAGGHKSLFCYLLKHYDSDKLLQPNHNGWNVAHSAAATGAIWFLRSLFLSHPNLFAQNVPKASTILHAAAINPLCRVLCVIIDEFKVNINSQDAADCTVLDLLTRNIWQGPQYQQAIEYLQERYFDEIEIFNDQEEENDPGPVL